ncbi:DUF2169 domain-containing protein [Xenorhabdus japonica]|uniref:DUF2169 domain-containing protein n=1 Tax=Xenorhabdus japonica TaxID=53341 RepID=A0A1I4ZD77_9GAMM|nr:hypothetical protein SAMN05421579_10584 [Xenorhabdus japonica]
MLDTKDEEYHVVAMKIVYQLQPVLESPYSELTVEDIFSGEMNQSSVLQESDLAPLKFKCDVITNGVAYAPGGKDCEKMPVRLQVTTHDRQALIDKTLHFSVYGEHGYQSRLC